MDAEAEALRQDYLRLVHIDLPAEAKVSREPWPVSSDHCFMRIVLDNLLGRCWYDALDRRRPAYRQLTPKQLHEAIALARSMLNGGAARVHALNDRSLEFRHKGPTHRHDPGSSTK